MPLGSTNQAAEIHAAIAALDLANILGWKKFNIVTDSNYVVLAATVHRFSWEQQGDVLCKKSNGKIRANSTLFIELFNKMRGNRINWYHERDPKEMKEMKLPIS